MIGTKCRTLSSVVSPFGHVTYATPRLVLITNPSTLSGPVAV
jgi:hypothetical protein